MSEYNYKEDLKEIKDIMHRSSRFISLSGYSGIAAGIIALAGAYAASQMVYTHHPSLAYDKVELNTADLFTLLLIATSMLIVAVTVSIIFTRQVAKRRKEKLWDLHTKRLLLNLAIPLATGGILGLMLLVKGYLGIIAPLTLIFYGLALVNASKYTLSEVRILGLAEVILGLLSVQFIGYGLLFWAAGFGLLHIGYGILMQIRHGA